MEHFYAMVNKRQLFSLRNGLAPLGSLHGCGMSNREWFDPIPEELNVVPIDPPIIKRAKRWMGACETCKPDEA
jgi:hypothetical protein